MNKHELEALKNEYLTHEARVLYLMCIRPHMDYASGICGRKRKVSYQMFKEHLEVHRRPGSKIPAFIPTLKQLRGYVDELVHAGLISKLDKLKRTDPLVFRCLLATTDLVRPSEEGQEKGKQRGQKQGQYNPQQNQEVSLFDVDKVRHRQHLEEGHTSVTSDISTTSMARVSFPMQLEWRPSDEVVDRLRMAGFNPDHIKPDDKKLMLFEFTNYWLTQNRTLTQAEWDHKFVQHVIKLARRGHEKPQSTRTPASSAFSEREGVARRLSDLDDDFTQ
ncbi:MAG: DnaT-like ssDNA-binding domain-containing protein [Pontibacterium sp.]